MEKFVMANGIPIRYSDYGKGEQVICLIHGYQRSIETWDSFGGLLGKQYRVIASALPGHGMSDWGEKTTLTMEFMADTVSEVLGKAGVGECCMVGHSMGGYVVSAMVELHPELLSSIVFFHSNPNADSPEKVENRKREIEIIEADKKELLALTNPEKGFAPQNIRTCTDTIDEFAEQIMMMENSAITATLRGMIDRPDRSQAVASFPRPTLFIFGRADNYIPIEAAHNIIAQQPRAQIEWLENSGHYGFIEQPRDSYEILHRFLSV